MLVAALESPQGGRGRPPSLSTPEVDSAGRITSRARAAWLCRVSRLHGRQVEYRNLTKFAKALQASGVERVSPSTISRIETGLIAPTFEIVRGYENLLGMRAYSMVSILDTSLRYRASRFDAKPLLPRRRQNGRVAYRRFDELVERACSDALMSGAEWDELTILVTERPDLMVSPRSAWLSLTNRLLTEEIISDGVPWMQRFEAVNRMLAHPMVGIDALSTLRAIVDDRGVQSLVGTACLFDASAEPKAATEVLRHMTDPADDRVFKGSLMACVRKLKYTQFTGPQLQRISDLVAATLMEPTYLDDETLSLAVSVLRQLPRQSYGALSQSLLKRMTRDRSHISVLEENRLLGQSVRRVVTQRIANHAMARTPTVLEGYIDHILPILVDEMLFDPVFDARLYAAFLIHASPYRLTITEALTAEIRSAHWIGNQAWLTAIFEALRILGGQTERNMMEHFVMNPATPGAIADVAAYALGHIGGTSSDEFWRSAIAYHRSAWERSASQVSSSILDRLIYAIGMSGNRTSLTAVRLDHRMPSQVRAIAGWWLDQSHTAVESARI